MSVERSDNSGSLIDVLDRVLDKGVVFDAWTRSSRTGIDLLALDTRLIASVELAGEGGAADPP